MTIEIQYQKFIRRKKDSSFRYLKLSEFQTIDFKQMLLMKQSLKEGDGSRSGKTPSFGVKTAQLAIRRGRYYDE